MWNIFVPHFTLKDYMRRCIWNIKTETIFKVKCYLGWVNKKCLTLNVKFFLKKKYLPTYSLPTYLLIYLDWLKKNFFWNPHIKPCGKMRLVQCGTILDRLTWMKLFNFHKLNLHMLYMWQCVIDTIVIANSGK